MSPGLLPQHQALLDGSAISEDVARARGYWSASKPGDLNGRFTGMQKRVPGLVIPVHNVYGDEAFCQLRPDDPREKDGKPLKYETPGKTRMVLDVPPATRPHLGNPKVTLWITEGIRKADSLVTAGLKAIALLGVWNWRGTNEHGGKTALPDWHDIALNDRKVVLAFDSDSFQNESVHKAVEELGRWLEHRGANLCFAYLPSDGGKVGVDDYLAAGHSKDELVALTEDRWRPLPSEVTAKQKDEQPVGELRPTGELIEDLDALLKRLVVLPSRAAALTIALYVLHTWAFEAAHATPYLTIQSPVKRAGKTRLQEILELVVRSPWRVTAASDAAIFRKIEADRPTLLLDEVDALFGGSPEGSEPIRGLLNAGNRPGASVARCVGEGKDLTVADFSVYCPKVLAGINTSRWPDTVTDRSIIIGLRRKKPDEKVGKLRWRQLRAETEPLRAALARWAAEHMNVLHDAEPALPDQLDDRAAEGWEPLFAIADLAGVETGALARQAALKVTGERAATETDGLLLLVALKAIFADDERVSTETITTRLNNDDELPFGAYRRGDGIDGRGLSKLLKPFDIKPRTIRVGGHTAKGYHREQFADAWERYCPPKEPRIDDNRPFEGSDPSHPSQPSGGGGLGHFVYPSQSPNVTDNETAENAVAARDVTAVTDRNGKTGGIGERDAENGDIPLASPEEEALAERLLGTDSEAEPG